MPSLEPEVAGAGETLTGTIVVVDMVGYSSTARLLEENTSANMVGELNRQIQSFITCGFEALPEPRRYSLIATTGDGAIIFFKSGEAAHRFSEAVHLSACHHNEGRSELSAQRWFRVGIASGDVIRNTSAEGRTEYAGITIANAVRLETAAHPGQIVIDVPTYNMLPADVRKLYRTEHVVHGKRTEKFRAHRFQAVCKPPEPKMALTVRFTRRRMIALSGATVAAAAAAAWIERPLIRRYLSPLPEKRFVAIMAWPLPPKETSAILDSTLDSIRSRLSRAEAYVHDLLVISSSDLASVPEQNPTGTANSLGANLVLAASSQVRDSTLMLTLQVLDAATSRVLRSAHLSCPTQQLTSLNKIATETAADLLDLPLKEVSLSDDKELAGVSPDTYKLYVEAQQFYDEPNNTGYDRAIELYQKALRKSPRFALAYAQVAMCYHEKYRMQQDSSVLQLATQNAERCLRLRPDSAQGLLAQTYIYLDSGQNNAALATITRALQIDPMGPILLFAKARVYRSLANRAGEEQVYRDIIRDRPNYWWAYNSLGRAFAADAKHKEAAAMFRQAAVLAPHDAAPLFNLGVAQMELGDRENAVASFSASLARAPNPGANEALGDIAFSDGDYEKALKYYSQARDIYPRSDIYWMDIGDCFKRLNQPKKARENYQKAKDLLAEKLETNSTFGGDWMQLGLYHAKLGEAAAARSDMEKALALDKGASPVESQFTRAQILALLGEREQATRLVLECMDHGLKSWDLDNTVDIDEIKADPRYKERLKTLEAKRN